MLKSIIYLITAICLVLIVFGCKKEIVKNEKRSKKLSVNYDTLKKASSEDSLQLENKTNQDFKIGQLYNDSDVSLGSIYANYNSGKYKFEKEYPDFLVDSTLTEDEKNNSLLNLENTSLSAKDKNIISLRNFAVSNINN